MFLGMFLAKFSKPLKFLIFGEIREYREVNVLA